MNAIRSMFQPLIDVKRSYLNPHEHYGRANICRAALLSYVGIYFAFKWNSARKAEIARQASLAEKRKALAAGHAAAH